MNAEPSTEIEREATVPAPPDQVWESLEQMLGEEATIDPVEGGAVEVRECERLLTGEVLEADPGRRLALRWSDGHRESMVEIELEPAPGGTHVHVREWLIEPVATPRLVLLPAPIAPSGEPRMLAAA